MPDLRRWIVALASLLSGGVVTAVLVAYTSAATVGEEVYVVGHDLPAGAPLGLEQLRLERVRLGPAGRFSFHRGAEDQLQHRRTAHQLFSGQLLQRGDLQAASEAGDRRLVMVPLKDVPPLAPGDRIDLLILSGPSDRPAVSPFATGLEVVQSTTFGVVVAVPARQAAALVYGSTTARMVAVVAAAGAGGEEAPVASLEQALAALGTRR
jgi:hypothetical protein